MLRRVSITMVFSSLRLSERELASVPLDWLWVRLAEVVENIFEANGIVPSTASASKKKRDMVRDPNRLAGSLAHSMKRVSNGSKVFKELAMPQLSQRSGRRISWRRQPLWLSHFCGSTDYQEPRSRPPQKRPSPPANLQPGNQIPPPSPDSSNLPAGGNALFHSASSTSLSLCNGLSASKTSPTARRIWSSLASILSISAFVAGAW